MIQIYVHICIKFFQTNDNIKSHVQSLKIANIMKRKKKNTSKRNYDSKIPTRRSSYQNPRLRVEPKRLESSWNLLAGHSRGNKRRKRGAREKEEKSASRVRKRERERDRGGRKVHHTRRSERIPAARVNIEVQGRRKTSPSRGTRVDDYGLIPLYAHSHQPT